MDNRGDIVLWIQRQYFQTVAMKYFDWEELKSAKLVVDQGLVLKSTYLHALSQKYPPSNAYNLSFLKKLLALYEDQGWEICEDIYSSITDIIVKKQDQEDCFKHKSYILPCGSAITLYESIQFISQGTTGLNSWQAGIFLSNWLMQNKDILQGKTVLELGCGVGLTGLVALHCCRPKTYFFTDSHEKVLHKVQENLKINGFHSSGGKYNIDGCKNSLTLKEDVHTERLGNVHEYMDELNPQPEIKLIKMYASKEHVEEQEFLGADELIMGRPVYFEESAMSLQDSFQNVSSLMYSKDICETCGECRDKELTNAVVCHLDWQNWTPSDANQYSPDVILAADVIFEPSVIDSLVSVIKTLLSVKGQKNAVAYVASTVRNKETYQTFLLCLDKFGIKKSLMLDSPEKLFYCHSISETVLLRLEL